MTQEMVDACSIVVSGLVGGTGYMAQAFDGEVKIKFRTSGMQSGEVIHVTEADTITYLLDDCAARKVTDVSLVFEGGVTYNSGSVTIPGGIENLVFVGVASDAGELPVLEIPTISLKEVMNGITFENVHLDGLTTERIICSVSVIQAVSGLSVLRVVRLLIIIVVYCVSIPINLK